MVTGASGETVTVYYDSSCTKPYIFAQPTNGSLGSSSNSVARQWAFQIRRLITV